MTARRTIVGLCMLCALAFSAFAAQGAAAATKGTTAFTCKETGAGGTFTKAHCKPSDAGSGNFSHVAFAQDTTTETIATNEKTNPETNGAEVTKLKLTIAGVETELQAKTVSSTEGTLTNKIDETGEHYAHAEGRLHYGEVTVAKPAGKGCKVFKESGSKGEGEVTTKKLTGTTTGEGDNVNILPSEGTTFATFFVSCTTKVEALEGEWIMSGNVTCPTDGATIVCTHAGVTTAGGLKKGAVKAGIEGKLTLKARDPKIDPVGVFTPISATTVETP